MSVLGGSEKSVSGSSRFISWWEVISSRNKAAGAYLAKMKMKLVRSPACAYVFVSVFVSPVTSFDRLVDFDEILHWGDAIEGDRDTVILNSIAATIYFKLRPISSNKVLM
jgi:hypothetical protein